MKIEAKVFRDEILSLLDHLYESQNDAMEQTAQLMAQCIENDGVVHVFGSGHSVGLAIDISLREGSLVPMHIIQNEDAVILGTFTLEEFRDKENKFERRQGVAQYFYNLYDIHENDIFFVISNSGINGVGIDFAMLAKENGHKVIVITSMTHTLAEASRHPSGKKLYELGDIVIDNCGPHGDALLPTNGVEKVCSVSSICNNAIAQMCAIRTVDILNEHGYPAPVLNGDQQHDDALRQKYAGRV
ncbi:MAG: sugar isomerase domain-containing protein [Erysipelotrichaceae bacterium]|nr:sugar isomerase domain-containing protein [Erysipelotrichaceae bacterium]MBQ1304210.1 sugar isomerase domain-containing protein [Erysipelotrichaceae bacterium]MBQ1314563.1 sugar isomerase domain-containing protein [Erysipelotrichaceae bacterium]MBR2599980.1 sugar isomerase domain-containing protein [Erysipelotrichaceae bacterium]